MKLYLSETIKRLRQSKDLTQEQLADMLGVTAQAVSKWERGESMPETALLPKLAQILDTSIDELFSVEKKPVVEYVPEKQRDFNSMILRVSVEDGDDDVKINLPLSLVKAALEIGIAADSMKFGSANLSSIDFEAIIKMVENGAIGKIVEIDTGDGEHIVIEVI